MVELRVYVRDENISGALRKVIYGLDYHQSAMLSTWNPDPSRRSWRVIGELAGHPWGSGCRGQSIGAVPLQIFCF